MAAHHVNFKLPLRKRTTGSSPVDFDLKKHRGESTGALPSLPDTAGEHGGSKCSIRYLLMLLLELKKARADTLLGVSRISNDKNKLRRLRFLASEIVRLLEQPDLFTSPKVRARFLAVLGADSELQFSQACKALLLKREVRNLERNWRSQLTRTPYKDGSCGWENFLLNGAPGSGFASHCTIPPSIFQVVPAVGMRIIADYDREEAEIVRFVQEFPTPLDVKRAATTLMINFDTLTPSDQYVPDVQMSQESRADLIRPNPFRDDRRLRLDLVIPGSEELEIFSPFIHRLEFPPPPMNAPAPVLNAPNACPIVALRSWHPPTRLQDLRPLR